MKNFKILEKLFKEKKLMITGKKTLEKRALIFWWAGEVAGWFSGETAPALQRKK